MLFTIRFFLIFEHSIPFYLNLRFFTLAKPELLIKDMTSLAFENPPIIASFEIRTSLLQNSILPANRTFSENIVHELVLFIDKIEFNREEIAKKNY